MCTSLSVGLGKTGKGILFGRNMDIESHFGERVVIVPREMPLRFRCLPELEHHYAIIGMAAVADGYPLFADAMNEKGLCMAGLHFPGNAVYETPGGFGADHRRIAPFELIPYLLGTCATVTQVREALGRTVISDIHFSRELLNTPLHWHVAGVDGGVIIEVTASGLQLYEDRVGVLTNNPPYPYHVAHLHRYDGLDSGLPSRLNREGHPPLGETYDLGLGMVGLPGDYSSPARFVRCATLRRLTAWDVLSRKEAEGQFFRLLGAVAPPVGCVKTPGGENHTTIYTCCMDTATLTYTLLTADDIMPRRTVLDEALCCGETLKLI